MTHIEPGFYAFDARRHLTFEAAYTAGDCQRFERIEDATAQAQGSDRLEIIRVSVRPAAQPKQTLLAAGLTAPWVADEEEIPCWCQFCGEEIDSEHVLTFRECPACGAALQPLQPEEVS